VTSTCTEDVVGDGVAVDDYGLSGYYPCRMYTRGQAKARFRRALRSAGYRCSWTEIQAVRRWVAADPSAHPSEGRLVEVGRADRDGLAVWRCQLQTWSGRL